MKKKLLSNWPLKIASLLFAFCLWLIVINVEDPTNTQTFTNVSVKFENTEILTEQNLIYEVLEKGGLFIGRMNSDKNAYVNDNYIEMKRTFTMTQ